MANRDQLGVIRAARAGHAAAQLMLGRHYLFGGAGLPKNITTALHWLDRAASQDVADAWILIGRHIPFETARHAADKLRIWIWYERAFDAGVVDAGLVLAQLVRMQDAALQSQSMHSKARRALQVAAQANLVEAQWLLGQQAECAGQIDPAAMPGKAGQSAASLDAPAISLEWTVRAAEGGNIAARLALAEHAWANMDRVAFLYWALPMAHAIADIKPLKNRRMPEQDGQLLARCASALLQSDDADQTDAARFLERSAVEGNADSQLFLGLWLAKMDIDGHRTARLIGAAKYKHAIQWLTLAGEQGRAEAWFAIYRIYLKSEFSQRSATEARKYLAKAAASGHRDAQRELGIAFWRNRGDDLSNAVLAVYWLHKAAQQACTAADTLLKKIAMPAIPAAWAQAALQQLMPGSGAVPPDLLARVELAARFGLSRAEALLIDLDKVDRGHCLLIDIRAHHARSKCRLILIATDAERQALDRILLAPNGPDTWSGRMEGNYRQRLYRFKSIWPHIISPQTK